MAKPLATILKKYSDVISGKLPASEVSALTLGKEPGVDYAPKMADEREFVASHSVEKHPDRVGNGPDVYSAAKIKQTSAEGGKHGNIPDPKSKNAYKQANEEVEQGFNSANRKTTLAERIGHKYGKVNEAKDSREYDYEGEMAVTKLKTIIRASEHLIKMMEPNTNLPEWVQSKIIKAEDYITTAHDYLMSEMNEESSEYADAYARHRDDIKHLENNGFERVGDNKKGSITTYAYSRRFRPKSGEEHQQFITFSHNNSTRENGNVGSKTDKSWGGGPGTPARKETTGSTTKHDSIQDAIEKHNQAKKNSISEQVNVEEAAKCNMTEAGKMCEVHGKGACPKEGKESDKANEMPMYNGKKDKEGKKVVLLDKDLQEKAESEAQQKLMAMAYRYKKDPKSMPDASGQVKKLAKSMTLKQLHDYAATKHEGLPKKVAKESADTPIKMPTNPSNQTADYNSGANLGNFTV